MSKLGNGSNFGNKINIVNTHHGGTEILNSDNLYPNSIIISSPTTNEGVDITVDGASVVTYSHALFATDYEGTPVRLTYTMLPGNGLVVNPFATDVMQLVIGDNSLTTDIINEGILVDKQNIIDNYTLVVEPRLNSPYTQIKVLTGNLEKASGIAYGVVKVDDSTILSTYGVISVNTSQLDYVDDMLQRPGIVRNNPDIDIRYDELNDTYEVLSDYRTVSSENGVLRVITSNLDKANDEQLGVIRTDNLTTRTEQGTGVLSVITAGLDKTTRTSYGIVRPDNNTIQMHETMPGVVVAHAENMTGATTSSYGVVKLDEMSLGVSNTGYTYVNRYREIVDLLDIYYIHYNDIINRLIALENRIWGLENAAAVEYIYVFMNTGNSFYQLTEPVLSSSRVSMAIETIQVVFSIKTNCPFFVTCDIFDGMAPQVTLASVRQGEGELISASALINHEFDSTDSEFDTLTFNFNAQNYNKENDYNRSHTVDIKLAVKSVNNSDVCKVQEIQIQKFNLWAYLLQTPDTPTPETTSEWVITQKIEHGPYLYYRVNPSLQSAVSACISQANETQSRSLDDASLAQYKTDITNQINDVRNAATQSNYSTREPGIRSISTAFYGATGIDDLSFGNYVLVTAEAGAMPSHSFSFNVVSVIASKIDYKENGVIQPQQSYYTYSIERYTPDFSGSTIYGSNRRPVSLSVALYTRNYETNGQINDNNNPWVPADLTDHTWINTTISERSENNGEYNTLTIAATQPLDNKDRRATIHMSTSPTASSDQVISQQVLIELGVKDNLTFTMIEDLQDTIGALNITAECKNYGNESLEFVINRSNAGTLLDNEWGVEIKFYFRQQNEPTRTSSNSNSNVQTTSNSNVMMYRTIKKTHFSKNSFTESIKIGTNTRISAINEDASGNNNYVLPESLRNMLNGVGQNVNYVDRSGVSNDISSIVITEINVFNFASEPSINNNVLGSWMTQSVNVDQMSFGNAKITKLGVYPWDDNTFMVNFEVTAGQYTSIVNNTPVFVSDPNIVFFNGNTQYSYSNFYNMMNCEVTNWENNKCTVTMTLSQAPAPGEGTTTIQLYDNVYDRFNPSIVSVNSPLVASASQGSSPKSAASSGTDGYTLNEAIMLNLNLPRLGRLTDIRFYFKLTINNASLDFAPRNTNGLSNKVNFGSSPLLFNQGISLNPNISNQYYNSNPGITTDVVIESSDSISQLTNMVAELGRQVSILEKTSNVVIASETTEQSNSNVSSRQGQGRNNSSSNNYTMNNNYSVN